MTSTAVQRATLNPALKSFWLTPARNKVLYGGRTSSKSWDAAGFAIFLSTQIKMRVLCARQFQNKISESVYTLLKVQIDRFGLRNEFYITDNTIRHKVTGTEFIFKGLWRHIDEIKSLEGIDICWIEEAHALTAEQWEILEPTVRAEGSQFWIIFNPKLVTDFVYRKFVTGTPSIALGDNIYGVRGDTIKRQINFDENPFLSQTIIKVIENKRAESESEFNHIYRGQPKTDDASVIVKRSWVLAAIDAHKKLEIDVSGKHRVGFDIADGGEDDDDKHDANAIVATHGILTYHIDEWNAGSDELLKSAGRAYKFAEIDRSELIYDGIGMGAFVGARLAELNRERKASIEYRAYIASDKVVDPEKKVNEKDPNSRKNKDHFSNLKAQDWNHVADRFRHTYNAVVNGEDFDPDYIIAISSECDHVDQLVDELSTPKRDEDMRGREKVESKKDLKKRGVPSPNIADAFIMANSKSKKKRSGAVASGI